MSTKTSFKRIALVAASALAIAGFSAVPANAAVAAGNVALVATSGDSFKATNTSGNNAATAIAGAANSISFTLNTTDQSATYDGKTGGAGIISVSGAGSSISAVGTSITLAAGVAPTSATIANTISTNNAFSITTPTVGTIVVSYFKLISVGIYSATASESISVTVNAASVVGTVSATNSTSILSTTTATPFVGTSDATISAINTANLRAATVKVILKDSQSTGVAIAAKALTATVTGSGLVGGSTGTGVAETYTDVTVTGTLGRSITVNTDALGQAFFGIFADGSSGTGTITITQGTTVISTETVTFYGAVASLKATAKKIVSGTSGAATTAALDVIAYDSNNVVVPAQGITLTSGTSGTIASFTETTSTAAEAAAGTAAVDVTGVSGKSGAVVLTIKDTATGLITTTVTVNVGAFEAAKVTATFDSGSYTAGQLVTLTLTALDSSGNPVADSTGAALSLSIVTNGAVQGTMPTASAFKLGKQVITFYAPLVSVPLEANVTLTAGAEWATALDGTTIVASAEVIGDSTVALALDASNAATDAANNAYDEAQNATQAASDALAAVTALAAQVKSLIAMVKKLTAAVAKLKK